VTLIGQLLLLMLRLRRVSRRFKVIVATALTISVTLIPASGPHLPTLATKPSEWRDFMLEDGTTVTLGPRTMLTYSFDDRRRLVRLLKGEALFKVRYDPRRPFWVETALARAEAVGTIYSVTHQPHVTSITTAEGLVAVSRVDRPHRYASRYGVTESVRLSAGQKTSVESWTPLVARDVDTKTELAWAQRQLILTGQTVEQALREYNRRNWIQLAMPTHPQASTMILFGAFPLNDPEFFARHLEGESRRWARKPSRSARRPKEL
jgi:transmembrane sensor